MTLNPNSHVAREQLLRLYKTEVYFLRRLSVHLELDKFAKTLLADANKVRKEIEKLENHTE